VVKNRRVLARGRWLLLLRAWVDWRYLKLRTWLLTRADTFRIDGLRLLGSRSTQRQGVEWR